MLRCEVTLNGGPVAIIVMRELSTYSDVHLTSYEVNITIDKGGSVGTHRRVVYGWPQERFNPILLVKAALDLIDPAMAVIEGDVGDRVSPDLARQIGGTLPEVQAGEGELHYHRSPVWSEQSEQHGSDSIGEGTRPEDRERPDPGAGYRCFQCSYECASAKDCKRL